MTPPDDEPAGEAPLVVGGGPPPTSPTFRLVNASVRVLVRLARVQLLVDGLELLPDRPGVILASNHLSLADPVLLAVVVHRAVGRRVRHMAKAEAVAIPVFGLLLRDYGGFAVRRGRPDREAYRMAREVLAGGDWLGLAPEGTRSRTGTLGEPKPGVALLAVRTGAEIAPVAIWGSEELWPVGAMLPRPGKSVHIRFGAPYRPDVAAAVTGGGTGVGQADTADQADRAAQTNAAPRGASAERHAALDAVSEDLMRRIAALLPEGYRGRFG
ncbi:MAG: lysophospholipid acyltransferase family protein [Candidatus Limnocylindrales bacterium]